MTPSSIFNSVGAVCVRCDRWSRHKSRRRVDRTVGLEHGYEVVVIEDATTSLGADMHGFAVNAIFPMVARARGADQVSEIVQARTRSGCWARKR